MEQKVFIVILNWNRKKDTLECVDSIRKLVVKDYELSVVVVDNGSTDGSIEAFQKSRAEMDNFYLVANSQNVGFAAGNNIGIKYAMENGADYIAVLNNDTVVDRNLVIELLKVMEEDPDIGAVSPKIYFAKGFEFHKDKYKKSELGKVIWYAGGNIDWANVYGKNRGVDEVDHKQYDKLEKTDFVTGACMFVRSEALKKTGVFDERYYMYLEDGDLSIRMKKKGWKVVYAPKGILWHKVAQSSGIGSNLNDYYITRNRLLFGMRFAPIRSKLALIKESIKFLIRGRRWQKKRCC